MPPIAANIGVPMLYLQMPVLMMTLPEVIALEAWLFRRWLGIPRARAWLAATIANAVSTLLGFPLMWHGLVLLQGLAGGGTEAGLPEPWLQVYAVTVQAPWLFPYDDHILGSWAIPTAGMVLLIPAFFVTVFIERLIYRRAFKTSAAAADVKKATWKVHLASYGLLFLVGFSLLLGSLVRHQAALETEARPPPDTEERNE